MKTLADFKREMQVGTKWMRKYAQESEYVLKIVGASYSTQVYLEDEKGKGTWLDFPKATEFEINSQGEAEIYWPAHEAHGIPRRLVLTYRKVI